MLKLGKINFDFECPTTAPTVSYNNVYNTYSLT